MSFTDLTGERFGKLVVLKRIILEDGSPTWLCQCDCGNQKTYTTNRLKDYAKSCGCIKNQNLIGKKFGRLTIIKKINSERSSWLCKCDCANETIVSSCHLKSGHTQSCGCLNDEKRKERAHKLYAGNTKTHPRTSTAKRIWTKRYKDGDITFERFLELTKLNCYYCKSLPSNKQNSAKDDKKASKYAKENGDFIYNGLDRVDNNLGHIEGNVVPCCWKCNRAKRARTLQEFIEWIKISYENLKAKNLL